MNDAYSGRLDAFRCHDDPEYLRRLDDMVRRDMEASHGEWGAYGGRHKRNRQPVQQSLFSEG